MRAFVAVEITDESVLNTISKLQSDLQLDARSVSTKNLHYTLQFLGDVPIDKIKDALQTINFHAFTIRFTGVGAFPNTRHPRVVWVGTDNNEIVKLAGEVRTTLEPLISKYRSFNPHVTILRIKNRNTDITKALKRFQNIVLGSQEITHIKLKREPPDPKWANIRRFDGGQIYMNVIAQAERLFVPSKNAEQKKGKIADMAFELVKREISKYPQIKEIEYGGSYPKGTWLLEHSDIDIFIKFDVSTAEKDFSSIAQKVGRNALKKYHPYKRFSEHPYIEAKINDTKVNVVPCYMVKEGAWKSAADRTQFHTKFMTKNLSNKMRNHTRILKQFLKNNGIYGAEISNQGFSGYISEVLMYNFGSFEQVIQAMANIKLGQIIGKATKTFDTIITITDPIDPERNLTAAISNENIGKFILLCRQFLAKPSISFFKQQKKRPADVLLQNCITVSFSYTERSPDMIWGQVKSAANAIAVQLRLGDYEVIKFQAHTDEKNKAELHFLLGAITISKYYIKEGPEFFNEHDSKHFISKNKKSINTWIKDKKIYTLEKRIDDDAQKFLTRLLHKDLNKSGIPKGLIPDLKKGVKINRSNKAQLLDLISTDATIFPST